MQPVLNSWLEFGRTHGGFIHVSLEGNSCAPFINGPLSLNTYPPICVYNSGKQ